MSRISVTHNGNECYILSATLIADGVKTMRVMYNGREYFWPKNSCEMVSPGRFAMKIELFDILFDQGLFKRTAAVKQVFQRNKQKIPSPRMPRIGKN